MLSTATHEAAHLVVFLFAGGDPYFAGPAKIKQKSGYVSLFDTLFSDNYFAETCVELAGPVCNERMGISDSKNPHSSDMIRATNSLEKLLFHKYSGDKTTHFNREFERAWNKTEQILHNCWSSVEHVADEFMRRKSKAGVISIRNVRKIAQSLQSKWELAELDYYRIPKGGINEFGII
ncbi:hypothetical protein NTG1052_140130 [Candidatus Nitrotoga sp. 1052]|nr:hypothetical protein NTG1052_140130 [Candidatus Nitrotoga sp. 1052]